MAREQWNSKRGFILAAISSAVGLGNIWRFPYVAFKNGGGAFMIPYLIAVLTTGISFVAFEFIIGKKYRGSAPLSFFRMNKKIEFVGWWQFAISFVIMTYYAVILAWTVRYIGFSFNLAWGEDTKGFLYDSFLHVGESVSLSGMGGFVPGVLIPLLVVWLITLGVTFQGVKKGIEKVSKIAMPVLIILFVIFVIRAVTLPGAAIGLNAFFEPEWSSLAHPDVWIAAYSQIFYSLSLAMGIMITYSSYLPKDSDTTNSAYITGFANSGFELLSGIGIFAAIGFMAHQTGVSIDDLATGGIGLAFVVLPQIINQLPMSQLFGAVFFICLFIAGITSLISLVEVCISAVSEKLKLSRKKTVLAVGALAVLISIFYCTRGGLYMLDVVDNFINNFAILPGAVAEIILIVWVYKKLSTLQEEANRYSLIKVGGIWKFSIGVLTPVVLLVILTSALISTIKNVYGGYPASFVAVFGWGFVIALPILSIVISKMPWKNSDVMNYESEKGE